MQNKIRFVPTNQQNNDKQNKKEEVQDFSSVFLGKVQQKNVIQSQAERENDFSQQFLECYNSQKPYKEDIKQQDHILNQFQYQDDSTQFKQFPLDNVSNQNSGVIPLEMNYNQYSGNLNDNISHYNCQQSNKQSQNFDDLDANYGDSGAIRNVEVLNQPYIDSSNEKKELNIYERYYKNEISSYLLPIKVLQLEGNGMIDQWQQILWGQDDRETQIQQSNYEIVNQDNDQIKKNKRGNRKNKKKNKNVETNNNEQENQQYMDQDNQLEQIIIQDFNTENINQFDNGNMEELDDAVSEEFKMKITNFLEQNENSKISLTKTIYGNQQKSIKIIEIKDYDNQIQRLCKQFSNLKYSEIALSLQLIINFENCQQFLQTLKPKEEKLILREINQLIVDEQKAIDSKDQVELTKTQYKINEFKKFNQIQNIEGQSLYQTAIKIIELKNFKFDFKKCDSKIKQQKKADFELNRNQVITINNKKANIIKQYQTCNINENQCNQQLQQIRMEKKKLEEIGKNLFLDLMVIDNGFCRIDFHKFFSAEIENLLDGVFEKIESYKFYNDSKQIKLQIIVGKGLHSKDRKPIIGPITKQYIQQYLQQQVEIIEGKIDIII